MGLLTRLAHEKAVRAQTYVTANGLTAMDQKLVDWFGMPTASGKSVNEANAMKVSAIWCCRKILSESIGMLPWGVYRRTGDGNAERADDHWLNDLLTYSPNKDMTRVEFKETLTLGLTGTGNSHSLIERTGSRVSSLYPVPMKTYRKGASGVVTKLTIPDGEIFYRYTDRGVPEDVPREKVWHVKCFGNGIEGLSPIGAARETIGGALAMEEFANKFFVNGGMPAGTVTYPGWLKQDQRAAARENLQGILAGLGNAHKFALFEGGVKPEPWDQMNLEDMQFILSRKFGVLEVCRWFRIPPHMVAELEKGASYASIEQMSTEFVTFTLMPYLTRIEASAERWLLSAAEQSKYFLRFNFDALLRATAKERAEFLASMVNSGLMSRNEGRAKENLNKVNKKGMDDYTVQTALTPIDKLGEKPPAPAVPPGPKPPAPPQREEGARLLPDYFYRNET
jgi:HK97 family phage portal protein